MIEAVIHVWYSLRIQVEQHFHMSQTPGKTYIRNGVVVSEQPWDLSLVSRFFWGILNQASIFVQTLFSQPANANYQSGSFMSGGANGNGRREIGRLPSATAAANCAPSG
eukprot:TRINITY_DN2611_c0_g1_i1.p1 TRINITY_DN2611_c0_g1~~TRINITY_DN2611_c0_g1_i1.p1  ORF type:complete len:121 (-),score=6.81 TRINITY_DN2611_c0_g1_i1:171-497(-)